MTDCVTAAAGTTLASQIYKLTVSQITELNTKIKTAIKFYNLSPLRIYECDLKQNAQKLTCRQIIYKPFYIKTRIKFNKFYQKIIVWDK